MTKQKRTWLEKFLQPDHYSFPTVLNPKQSVEECSEAHRETPCFRQLNGHSLCQGCHKTKETF